MHYPLISMITPFDSRRGDLRQRLRQSQIVSTKICHSARISGHGQQRFVPPTVKLAEANSGHLRFKPDSESVDQLPVDSEQFCRFDLIISYPAPCVLSRERGLAIARIMVTTISSEPAKAFWVF